MRNMRKNYYSNIPVIYVNFEINHNTSTDIFLSNIKYRAFNAGSSTKDEQIMCNRIPRMSLNGQSKLEEILTTYHVLKHIDKFGPQRNIEFVTDIQYIHDLFNKDLLTKFYKSNWKKENGDKVAFKKELLNIYRLIQKSKHVVRHTLSSKKPQMLFLFKDKLLNI